MMNAKTVRTCVGVCIGMAIGAVALSAEAVRPAPRPELRARLESDCDVIGIVHWGLNTYTDREWGLGDEDPRMLDPKAFDADQIVGACAAGGIKGLVVVAKHHDGFCLWPTKTTEHNIAHSPFRGGKGDYVKEMEQACRRAGIEFGVYISPWDRNNAHYGTDGYLKLYREQIREILGGGYGRLFEIWFDNANGGDGYYGGAREKRTIPNDYYSFGDIFRMVRRLQPGICVFNEHEDADFRYGGNEKAQVDPESRATGGHFDRDKWTEYKKWANVGIRDGHVYHPIEADVPLRPQWFYHAKEDGRTKNSAYLMQRYLSSVGNSATLNIGISPNRDGILVEEDVRALRGFNEIRKDFFSHETTGTGESFNVIVMEEDLSAGEQVDGWEFCADGKTILSGTAIGRRRIRVLDNPVKASSCEIKVTRHAGDLRKISFRLYLADPALVKIVREATTESGETATAQWMSVAAASRERKVTANDETAPVLKKLGTIDEYIVEANPVVFKGKPYLCEYIRYRNEQKKYPGNREGCSYFRFRDLTDLKSVTSPCGRGLHMGNAFVDGDRVVITCVEDWGKSRFHQLESTDLVHWTAPRVILEGEGWMGYNTSVCKAGDKYVMVFELGGPEELVGHKFTMFFAESRDLQNWKVIPGASYGKEIYTGAPMLRWFDGWYYFFYLESLKGRYRQRVARSRDLVSWELSPKVVLAHGEVDRALHPAAVLSPAQKAKIAAAENRNASDLDMCECGGKLRFCYSWGDQNGHEFLALAEADVSEREFCEGFFRQDYPKSPARIGNETDAEKEARMSWWTRDRFGLFIHFGLYAMAARGETVRYHEWIPEDKYNESYFRRFDPDLFDAHDWARRARRAGMKYAVLTAKHHDGFCLWDSRETDYKITRTPFGRDLVREYAEAFRAEGLKVGLYYSVIDWHHPDFTIDRIHPLRPRTGLTAESYAKLNEGRDMARYRKYMFAQVRELLTDYGKVDVIWFDYTEKGEFGKTWKDWDAVNLVKLARTLQPGILIDNRLGLDNTIDGGDFVTPEQYKAPTWPTWCGRRFPWETCQTFSGSWGYARDEMSWKDPAQLVELLVQTVSLGGNLILNVGPTARGEFDSRASDRLAAIGDWLRTNGRSIYGCTQAPAEFEPPYGTLLTYNPERKKLYIHLTTYPMKSLPIAFEDRVAYAQFLHDGSELKIVPSRNSSLQGGNMRLPAAILLPVKRPEGVVPVIEVDLK